MPNSLVQSYAKKTGLSVSEVESKWESAKKYVKDHLNIKEGSGGKFYKAVVGTLKHWLKGKLHEEAYGKFITLLENTATADIAKYEQPLGIVTRKPNGVAYDGSPFFDLEDDVVVSKLLDGKKKHEPWKNLLQDKGIHAWANKNYLKSFHIRTKNGLLIKVR